MKVIDNKEARQAFLHELRRATSLQASIWDNCTDVIQEVLGHCDAVGRVIQINPAYAGRQLTDADLDSILMQDVKNLSAAARLTLLKAFQNAVNMQAELWIVASSLALTLGCTSEDVERRIWHLAIEMDTGMEVDEVDLQEFLGESELEGYRRLSSLIRPQRLN